MKIALFCSSRNIVPSKKTGGTEQPIFYLAKELALRGHEVVLFAAKGSKIRGVEVRDISLFQTCLEQKYLNIQERIASFFDLNALAKFFKEEADDFDVIQFNSYMFYEILPFTRFSDTPVIVRINYPHNLIYPYIKKDLKDFENVFFLPISKFIKSKMPGLKYLPPIYPSVEMNDFPLKKEQGDYLLFIGRICHNKGSDIAVKIAQKAKLRLILAGRKDHETGHDYYKREVEPFLNSNIQYVGEVGFKEKVRLYQGAFATLFPIQWDEPFGNVQIESMACGTPVISFNRGASIEAISNDVSGYIVKNENEFLRAIKKSRKLEPGKVRAWVAKNFSNEIIVDRYEKLYRDIISSKFVS